MVVHDGEEGQRRTVSLNEAREYERLTDVFEGKWGTPESGLSPVSQQRYATIVLFDVETGRGELIER